MKNKLSLLLVILAALVIPASAQISGGTAYRVISGNSLPSTCDPGPETTDVFIKTSATAGLYYCSAVDTWTAVGGGGGGSGDFVGPGSSTDNAVVRFDGTTGKLGQNSVVIIGDTGAVTGVAALTISGVFTAGSGPTTVTDSAGKVLSAALNTVQPAQGGTGITALGTGVATALGVNVGSAGAFVTFNGALGTPSSGTVTNLTGTASININGTVGATTPASGAFTTVTASSTITQTSNSATAFESGPNGGTNPVLRLVNSTASQADGVSITGLAAGNGVTFQALSSGTNTPISITAKGSGNVALSNSVASLTINSSQSSILGAPVFIGSGIRMANGQTVAFSNGSDYGRGLIGITGGIRVNQGESSSTGQGNFLITNSSGSVGTSGIGVLVIQNGTAPTSSPADESQVYNADSAAGDANLFTRNEAGEINRLTGLTARVSTQFDKTSSTTLGDVTGLTRNVEAGRTYSFVAVLYTTSNSAGGVKAAIGGTATATSIVYEAEVKDGSTFATMGTARATTLATAVGDVTAVTAAKITITGTIVVNAAGTLTVQFAQNASNGTASSVLINSSFQLIPIS